MTCDRIVSQCGKVIAADFARPASSEIKVELKSQILYQDDHIVVVRYSASRGANEALTFHLAANLLTGEITSIT